MASRAFHSPGMHTGPITFNPITSVTAAFRRDWFAGLVSESILILTCSPHRIYFFFTKKCHNRLFNKQEEDGDDREKIVVVVVVVVEVVVVVLFTTDGKGIFSH